MHVTLVTEMSNKQYHSLHIPITLYHANPLIRTRMHRPIFQCAHTHYHYMRITSESYYTRIM